MHRGEVASNVRPRRTKAKKSENKGLEAMRRSGGDYKSDDQELEDGSREHKGRRGEGSEERHK